jgi:hypothetical protein
LLPIAFLLLGLSLSALGFEPAAVFTIAYFPLPTANCPLPIGPILSKICMV